MANYMKERPGSIVGLSQAPKPWCTRLWRLQRWPAAQYGFRHRTMEQRG